MKKSSKRRTEQSAISRSPFALALFCARSLGGDGQEAEQGMAWTPFESDDDDGRHGIVLLCSHTPMTGIQRFLSRSS